MKTVVIFAGSQEIQDPVSAETLSSDLESFLENNKDKIEKILFGAGVSGVMGQVFRAARKVGILIHGYSIERYRKYDQGNGVDPMTFFTDDDIRIRQFSEEGDVFLALPGAFGTIKEVLTVKDLILESERKNRRIYIPHSFSTFVTLFDDLRSKRAVYPADLSVIHKVGNLSEIVLEN